MSNTHRERRTDGGIRKEVVIEGVIKGKDQRV